MCTCCQNSDGEKKCYVHTATTTITTTQAKCIKVKLSSNILVNVELNQNKVWSCRFSIGWQSNIAITAYIIKLDFSG